MFKYLGWILTAGDENWPAVTGNLVKARNSWGRLTRILIREGADKRISGTFFKAVVQQVLLFGAETWVLTPRIERALDSFMHGSARRITGRQPHTGWDGKCYYPYLAGAMKETGFTDIRNSITNRQNTVAQYIATRPLLDLCEQTTRSGGARVSRWWWDQKGSDWGTANARAEETDSESETDTEVEVKTKPEEKESSTSSGVNGSRGAEWSGASVDPWK